MKILMLSLLLMPVVRDLIAPEVSWDILIYSLTGHYIPLHALDEHLHNLVARVGYVGNPVQQGPSGGPINGSIEKLNLG